MQVQISHSHGCPFLPHPKLVEMRALDWNLPSQKAHCLLQQEVSTMKVRISHSHGGSLSRVGPLIPRSTAGMGVKRESNI